MLPRDRGTIVQVGSALAYRGIPLQAPYCGAKHAMKGFFESLRCELRHRELGRPHDHGPAPRHEHAAVRPLPEQDAAPPDAGAADLPARGCRPARCTGPLITAAASCTSASRPSTRSSATRSRRGWPSATWPRPRSTASRPRSRSTAPRREPVRRRSTTTTTRAPTASFDDQAHRRSPQAWLSRHRLGIGAGERARRSPPARAVLLARRSA